MKTCSQCDSAAELRGRCRPCYNAYQRDYWANRGDRPNPSTKRCKACSIEKAAADFPKSGIKGSGLRAQCKACEAARRLQRHIEAPEEFQTHRAVVDPATGQLVKVCPRCGDQKPTTEFYRQGQGIRPRCKTCTAKDGTEAYTQRFGRVRPYAPRPGKTREQVLESQRAYNKRRLTATLAYNTAWRARLSPEDRARYDAQVRETKRRYARANPQVHAAKEKRRRARKAGAPIVEIIDRAALIERDASTCYLWCGRVLADDEITLDHVVPLARGGDHTADNLRVACKPCNSRKGSRLLEALGLA